MTRLEILRLTVFVSIPALSFCLFHLLSVELQENNVLTDIRKRYRLRAGQRLLEEEKFYARYGKIENQSFLYRIDRLLLNSGIRARLPKLTAGKYLFCCSLLFTGTFLTTLQVTGNLYTALFSGALAVVVVYLLILSLYGSRYNRIEDETALFVSLLMNYAKGSSDIITIMECTRIMMDGPFRDLIDSFLTTASQTGNIDIAFDYMKESVDNRQLQTILINLKNCMHYMANYEEVLRQMMSQITAELSAREERKNILYSMKITLAVISVASLVIVLLIGAGLGIHTITILTAGKAGQFLLFVTGILYLFVLIRLFGVEKG